MKSKTDKSKSSAHCDESVEAKYDWLIFTHCLYMCLDEAEALDFQVDEGGILMMILSKESQTWNAS